jgi:hypothetical protein
MSRSYSVPVSLGVPHRLGARVSGRYGVSSTIPLPTSAPAHHGRHHLRPERGNRQGWSFVVRECGHAGAAGRAVPGGGDVPVSVEFEKRVAAAPW